MSEITWPLKDGELAEILGIKLKTVRSHKCNLNREGNLTIGTDYILEKNRQHKSSRDFETWKWLELGAQKVAACSGTSEAIGFLSERGIKNGKLLRVEPRYMDIIISSLHNITVCQKNFPVIPLLPTEKTYRIDLYIPKYKIAIECDETHHSTPKKKEADRQRQEYIEDNLGCYFIRFNPLEKNFNIGNVINDIMLRIIDISRV